MRAGPAPVAVGIFFEPGKGAVGGVGEFFDGGELEAGVEEGLDGFGDGVGPFVAYGFDGGVGDGVGSGGAGTDAFAGGEIGITEARRVGIGRGFIDDLGLGMKFAEVKTAAGAKHLRDDFRPAVQVGKPRKNAGGGDYPVELFRKLFGDRIEIGFDEAGGEIAFGGELAGTGNGVFREIDSGDFRSQTGPGKRIHAEMTLEMENGEIVDGSDGIPIAWRQGGAAGAEFFDVVKIGGEMEFRPGVPEVAVGFLFGSHAGSSGRGAGLARGIGGAELRGGGRGRVFGFGFANSGAVRQRSFQEKRRMFTGIVQEKGRVLEFRREAGGWRLSVEAEAVLRDLAVGDSIAVDGCCLTATEFGDGRICFDLLEETVRVTKFGVLRAGDFVNLEESLRFNGKVGGHFVTGHVDGVGRVRVFEKRGNDYFLEIEPPTGAVRYLIYKGSIAINGVSLTVAEAGAESFAVWLIPHTLQVTNLGELRDGDAVNLEFDMLGKYVERLLSTSNIPAAK